MCYKSEFGRNFELGFNLSEFPFLEDCSYHNDECPRFEFHIGEALFILHVDYEDAAKRENADVPRYGLLDEFGESFNTNNFLSIVKFFLENDLI